MNKLSSSVFLTLLSISSIESALATGSTFTICDWGPKKCITDTKAVWVNELKKRNYETRKIDTIKYDGIAISSTATKDNVTLFIKGYKGVGKYNLKGTSDNVFSSDLNAVYSDDVARWAHWVSPQKTNGSYIQITSDKGGLISGIYKITTYYEGKSKNNPVKLEGVFKNIPKSAK